MKNKTKKNKTKQAKASTAIAISHILDDWDAGFTHMLDEILSSQDDELIKKAPTELEKEEYELKELMGNIYVDK